MIMAVDPQNPAQSMTTIGDITCTITEVITPSGRAPVGGVTWTFTDMSRTKKEIPVWAIACTVIFFLLCFLGLLFLLVREERTEGLAQITVQGPGLLHVSQIPVTSRAAVADIDARVRYARSLGFNNPRG